MADPNEFYSDAQRKLQAEQDSTNLAEAMAATIVFDELQEDQCVHCKPRLFLSLKCQCRWGADCFL